MVRVLTALDGFHEIPINTTNEFYRMCIVLFTGFITDIGTRRLDIANI